MPFKEQLSNVNPKDFTPIESFAIISSHLLNHNICAYPIDVGRTITDKPRDYMRVRISPLGDIENCSTLRIIIENNLVMVCGKDDKLAQECIEVIATGLGQEVDDNNTNFFTDPILPKLHLREVVLDFPTSHQPISGQT